MLTARIRYSSSIVRTLKIGWFTSRPRTISRSGATSADGSPADWATMIMRCGLFWRYGRYTKSDGGSAMKMYLLVLATPTIWTHVLSRSFSRNRLPSGS